MPLTALQRKTPFRPVGTRMAPYSTVLERSLYEGSEEEWMHWQEQGVLVRALENDTHRFGVLTALAQGWKRGQVPLERLVQAWEWAGPAAWERLGWAAALFDSNRPDAAAAAAQVFPGLPMARVSALADGIQASAWERAMSNAWRARTPQEAVAWAQLTEEWLPKGHGDELSRWLATATFAFLKTGSANEEAVHAVIARCVQDLLARGARADVETRQPQVSGNAWWAWWAHHTWGQVHEPTEEAVKLGQALLRSGGPQGLSFSPSHVDEVLRTRNAPALAPVEEAFRASLANPWQEETVRGLGSSIRHALDVGLWDEIRAGNFDAQTPFAERGVAWLEYLASRTDIPPVAWLREAVPKWIGHMQTWAQSTTVLSNEQNATWTRNCARAVLAWEAVLTRTQAAASQERLPSVFDVFGTSAALQAWHPPTAWSQWSGRDGACLRLLGWDTAPDRALPKLGWLLKSLVDLDSRPLLAPLASRWGGWWWAAALYEPNGHGFNDHAVMEPLLNLAPPDQTELPNRRYSALAGALNSPLQGFALAETQCWPLENLWVHALRPAQARHQTFGGPDLAWSSAWRAVTALQAHGYPLQPVEGPSLLARCMALPAFPLEQAQEVIGWGADPTLLPDQPVPEPRGAGHQFIAALQQASRLEENFPAAVAAPRLRM